jgi:hypothetical protein
VIEALAEIPRVMENAARYVDIYRRMPNQYLDHRSFELFRAVIKSLSLIFQFMLEGKRSRWHHLYTSRTFATQLTL